MNKGQIIDFVAGVAKTSKADAENVLSTFFAITKQKVRKGEEVKIKGFGTFTRIKRKARNGHNPQTGASIKVPATWVPKFRPGKEFKALVK